MKHWITVFLILLSGSLAAHPGHDHSSLESPILHLVFYGAIASVVMVITWYFLRRNRQDEES